MADTAVAITAGAGTNIDTRTESTNSNHRQVIVIGDPATNAGVAPVDGTAGLKVDLGTDNDVVVSGTVTANAGTNLNTSALALETGGNLATLAGIVSSSKAAVKSADGDSITFGAKADAKSTATDTTPITAMSVWKQISASVQLAAASLAGSLTVATHAVSQSGTWNVTVNAALAAGSNVIGGITAAASAFADGALVTIGVKADAKSTATDTTAVSAMSVWKQISASVQALVAMVGQTTMSASQPVAVASDQNWPKGMSPRAFSATFTTLTRPANVTPYSAGDSISNNATAGSVTALSATLSDTNDDPVTITEIVLVTTDTGLAGKKVRAYLYNSDPTASSGVGGGDNAAFSQKHAGYVGSFMGWMESGFSDGAVGRLVPTYNETNNTPAGGFVVTLPASGAKTLYIQYQAVEAFTSSANSTTLIGTAKGFQSRAA